MESSALAQLAERERAEQQTEIAQRDLSQSTKKSKNLSSPARIGATVKPKRSMRKACRVPEISVEFAMG
jgi:hypothetical protein